MSARRIAVIGSGPVGLEAALYGASLGHDVQVYERGRLAENVRSWGFVTLFSDSRRNRSSLGLDQLQRMNRKLPGPESYLTGEEHVATYLEPLAACDPLRGRIHLRSPVVQIGREGIGKRDLIGGKREQHPFRLLIEGERGEYTAPADIVLDCSGSYGLHNWMGDGNIPALGERELEPEIAYKLEDIGGTAREGYAGKRVLLVGSGQSAATALDSLVRLPGTTVEWVCRSRESVPLPVIPDDPLPQRARLSRLANQLAAGASEQVRHHAATAVTELRREAGAFVVTLRGPHGPAERIVDRILAHVGYTPDGSLHRELQIHECWATSGPMKLAAALLSDGSADCLAQTSKGPDVLRNPEPDYYILGAKSYGRNSSFLIQLGLEQVREVYTMIEGRPELNLYAA